MGRLRGFWWKGFQTGRMRGMFRFVPESASRRRSPPSNRPSTTSPRRLAAGSLRPARFRVSEAPAAAWSSRAPTRSPQAATLVRLFEEAKFIHVVRDGRDASASRVAQTRGSSPRGPCSRASSGGRSGSAAWTPVARDPPDRLLTLSLDELLLLGREGPAAAVPVRRRLPPAADAALLPPPHERRHAHAERWREGLPERQIREIERLYEEALDRLEADGVACAPLLRRRSAPAPSAEAARRDGLPGGRRPRARGRPMSADLVFVGGTGRSGTHVISRLLGRHSRYEMIPIECRFHFNPRASPTSSPARRLRPSSSTSCAASGGTGSATASAPRCAWRPLARRRWQGSRAPQDRSARAL